MTRVIADRAARQESEMRRTWSRSWFLAAMLMIGCAPATVVTLRVAPESYQRVPEKVREGAAHKETAELTSAQQELERATQEQQVEQRELEAAPAEQHTAQESLNLARAQLAAAPPAQKEQARLDLEVAEAGIKVEDAKQGWLVAREHWRQCVIEAAKLHVATAEAAVELARAQVLSRYDDSVEVERYRGQHGRLHQLWSAEQLEARKSRQEVDRLATPMHAEKSRYAERKSVVLQPPVVQPPVVVVPPVIVRPVTPPPGPMAQ